MAAQQFVKNVAGRSSGDPRYRGVGWGFNNAPRDKVGGAVPVMAEMEDDADGNSGSGAVQDKQNDVGDNVNDFGTNNQEEGIEEGDIIVASENAGEFFCICCTPIRCVCCSCQCLLLTVSFDWIFFVCA